MLEDLASEDAPDRVDGGSSGLHHHSPTPLQSPARPRGSYRPGRRSCIRENDEWDPPHLTDLPGCARPSSVRLASARLTRNRSRSSCPFGTTFPTVAHAPSSWFLTTSTACSDARFRAYCSSIRTWGSPRCCPRGRSRCRSTGSVHGDFPVTRAPSEGFVLVDSRIASPRSRCPLAVRSAVFPREYRVAASRSTRVAPSLAFRPDRCRGHLASQRDDRHPISWMVPVVCPGHSELWFLLHRGGVRHLRARAFVRDSALPSALPHHVVPPLTICTVDFRALLCRRIR